MRITVPVQQPYSFAQTVAFLRRFPPCQGDYVVTDSAITAAVSVGGIARPFTLHAGAPLTVELPRHVDATTRDALVARAGHLIGADDDLARFYAAAAGDAAFAPRVDALRGLHHVRFLTLEEVALYAVLTQRTPIALAATYKRRFLARFGIPVDVGVATLRAMPEFDHLLELSASEIADAIGHARKAAQIVDAVRGVAAIGEPFLRTAPYAAARDALLDVPGIGPFSALFILLRGLGRMDELPELPRFEPEARALYGGAYDPEAVLRRYGPQIGYWSFYLKAGAGPDPRPQPAAARAPRRGLGPTAARPAIAGSQVAEKPRFGDSFR